MGINRGKQFEEVVKKGFFKLPNVAIDRMADPASGYSGIKTYCDFIVYKKPLIYYIECKAVSGNTLNFQSHITENQWNGLFERTRINGAISGILVWFIEHDVTLFIDIRLLYTLKNINGKKSIRYDDVKDSKQIQVIKGKKKRVLFEYDFETFLKDMEK